MTYESDMILGSFDAIVSISSFVDQIMRHIPCILVFFLMMAAAAGTENTKPNTYDGDLNLDDFLDEYYKEDNIAKRGDLQTTEKRNRKVGRKLLDFF